MKKSRAQKDILYIAISSFVLVVLWIGFNIYHAYATSTITPELQAQIEEINPTFDSATIQNLKGRSKASPVYEIDVVASSSPQPEVSPSPSIGATPQVDQSGLQERLGQ